MTKIRISGNCFYNRLDWQYAVHMHPARIKVLICGTKAGKTTFAINEGVEFAVFNAPAFIRWVAPVYDQAEIGWRRMWADPPEYAEGYLSRDLVLRKHEAEMWVNILGVGGTSRMEFKSAEKPEHLRGENVNLVIVDEADECKERAWTILESNLTKTRGKAIIITTPSNRGKTWVYELAMRGLKPENEHEIKTWIIPTIANPYITAEELERKRRSIPKEEWLREYLAQFVLSDIGSVFGQTYLDDCTKGSLREYNAREIYAMGVDLGKDVNATVIIVLDINRHLCYFKRIPPRSMSWPQIYNEIERVNQMYGDCYGMIDSRGPGSPAYDELVDNRGLDLEGFNTTSARIKAELIKKLVTSIEQKQLTFPPIPELRRELDIFSFFIKGENVKYGAPSRELDDCVLGLAIANHAVDFIGDPAAIRAYR